MLNADPRKGKWDSDAYITIKTTPGATYLASVWVLPLGSAGQKHGTKGNGMIGIWDGGFQPVPPATRRLSSTVGEWQLLQTLHVAAAGQMTLSLHTQGYDSAYDPERVMMIFKCVVARQICVYTEEMKCFTVDADRILPDAVTPYISHLI